MPKLKVDAEDLEAALSIISVYRGQRAPGCHFDGRDRRQVAAFYAVRIANLENAARDQRTKPTAPKRTARSARV